MKKFITKPVIGFLFLFFLFTQPAKSQSTISGHIYNDKNNNRSFDPGEGMVQVHIWLFAKAAVSPFYLVYPVKTSITSEDGSYTFHGVSPGEYQIRINMISLNNTAIIDLGYKITRAVVDNNLYESDNYPNGITEMTIDTTGIYDNVNFGFQTNFSGLIPVPQKRFAFDTGPNSFINVMSKTYDLLQEVCNGVTYHPTITFTTDRQCTISAQTYPQAGNISNAAGVGWPGSNKGGFYSGDVTLQMKFGGTCYTAINNDNVTLTVNFSTQMRNVRFTIYDIDAGNPQLWDGSIDHVKVTGYNGSNPVSPLIVLSQISPFNTISQNTVSGWPDYPDNNSVNNYPDTYNSADADNGNANIYFTDIIDKIVIEYEEYAPEMIPSVKKISVPFSPVTSESQWDIPINPIVRGISIGSIGYDLYCITLSAKLLSFEAKANGQQVNLQWKTANEQQMQQYRVERLLPDGSWKNLGSIMAGSGPVYNFTDKHPVKGINQYRLAMINLDASYQYSEIRKAIIANTANDIEIVRNPDVSLEVIVYGEASEVMVYDLSGHQLIDHPVKNSNNSPGSIKISFSQYPLIKGLYFVKAIFTNGEEKVLKFMKK